MTKPELQQQLDRAHDLLAKLKDRQARGEKVGSSITVVKQSIRYLKLRLMEES